MTTFAKRTSFAVALFMLPALLAAAHLETGAVKNSDGGSSYVNAIPSVARLHDGTLLTVWTAQAKQKPKARIFAALSGDGGRTWSEPQLLIDTPGMEDGDPNILVDGTKVFVYSTTVPMRRKGITGSEVFMVESENEGRTWSAPVRIQLPYAYLVGKIHNGLKLMDGTLAMAFSWDLWAQKGIPARTEGEMNLASGILLSHDGIHWTPYGQIHAWPEKITPYSVGGLCEPALVQLQNGDLLMILRAGTMFHYESRSHDGGLTWDPPQISSLIGHNNPVALWRLDQRPDEIIVSYPGITQAQGGTFVAVWQQQLPQGGRDVRWARFTRAWVLRKDP